VSLPVINWCINQIVLRVEWWFDGKQFSSLNHYEVKLYLLQQLLAGSQSGEAIGFRQLLYVTLFDTVELEIAINYFVYSQLVSECQFHMRFHDSIGAFLNCLPD